MSEERKSFGVYVPPPREKARPIGERIEALKARPVIPAFVGADPLAQQPSDLAKMLGTSDEDWARRESQHLDFLEHVTSFFELRQYLLLRPHEICGWWVEQTEDMEAHWYRNLWDPGRAQMIERCREHLLATFRKVLKDAVCEHGERWDDYQPKFAWERGVNAGCGACKARYVIETKGGDPEILKLRTQKHANTLLAWLGLRVIRGESGVMSADSKKLESMDSASQRDKRLGGKRVTPRTPRVNLDTGERSRGAVRGPDSDEKRFEDTPNGADSRDNLIPEPKYGRQLMAHEAGITNDAKKLKKIYKALVTREEEEAAKERGDFTYHPLPKVEKEIRKRVRERMRIEFPDYLRQRQALNEAEKKATLPVKSERAIKDKRRYERLPKFDSTAAVADETAGDLRDEKEENND